jgi:hypothetical protein
VPWEVPFWIHDVAARVWTWEGGGDCQIHEWRTELGSLFIVVVDGRMVAGETTLEDAKQVLYDHGVGRIHGSLQSPLACGLMLTSANRCTMT